MRVFYKKFFNFCFALALCICPTFTPVWGQGETIPLNSTMGASLLQNQNNNTKDIGEEEIKNAFLQEDKRKNEDDSAYALLYIRMNQIDPITNKETLHEEAYKGSGIVLYRSGDYVLVMTTWHSLYKDRSAASSLVASEMKLLLDNKNGTSKNTILAEMVKANYARIGSKDIVLVAMKLNQFSIDIDLFENNKATFGLLDLKKSKAPGKNNSIVATINQYPTFFDWYVKINGLVYHDGDIGYHNIPTLPGSSGSAIIVNNKIVGVHSDSGEKLSSGEEVKYRGKNILVKDNRFDLISLEEIKDANNAVKKIRKAKDKTVLTKLIQSYIDELATKKQDL
jgi:hypothetical protein